MFVWVGVGVCVLVCSGVVSGVRHSSAVDGRRVVIVMFRCRGHNRIWVLPSRRQPALRLIHALPHTWCLLTAGPSSQCLSQHTRTVCTTQRDASHSKPIVRPDPLTHAPRHHLAGLF